MSEIYEVCKVRKVLELECRRCKYFGEICENYIKTTGHIPYTEKIRKKDEERKEKTMAIRTGKFSLKAMMEGKTKISKEELVGARSHVIDIVKGTSEQNGDYVYLFLEDLLYVSVPAANLEEFMDYASDPEDAAAIRNGQYDVIFEKATSKIGRTYYTCYLEDHEE